VTDLSEFRAKPKQRCVFIKSVAKLDDDEYETLQAALVEPDIDGPSIVRWLDKRDVEVSLSSVYKHRKAECICGR